MRKGPATIVGRCYACRLPVRFTERAFVEDRTVTNRTGRAVRRLCHLGECERELRYRIGPWQGV